MKRKKGEKGKEKGRKKYRQHVKNDVKEKREVGSDIDERDEGSR